MASPKATYRVAFSEMSTVFVYEDDELYRKNLAYNQEEYDAFGVETLLETQRIQNLISSTPYDSPKDSLRFLIKTKTIDIDEIGGIENLLFCKPSTVKKVRKNHSNAVLRKQHELRQQQLKDPVEKLSKFAEKSSSQSTYLATVRAGIARAA